MLTLQHNKYIKSKEKLLGQFFTPPEVADFIISMIEIHLEHKDSGCDPACGEGVFLNTMIKHRFKEVVGVDIDKELANRIAYNIKEKANIFIENALIRNGSHLKENYFDVVVGNPPFSSKYGRVKDKNILANYELGSGFKSQAIEVLFLERFIQLAKNGGFIGIILPDGILLNVNYKYLREFILNRCKVLAIVSLPRGIFNSSKDTTSKTSILILKKGEKNDDKTFISQANSLSDLHYILKIYRERSSGKNSAWVFVTSDSLHPKSYLMNSPEFKLPTIKLGEMIVEMLCGSTEYGDKRIFSDKGIRFISAKVVTPLGIDFSKDNRFVEPGSAMDKKRAHVRIGDLLFVRVGVGCIGRVSVVVDENDVGIADDWIYIIRLKEGFSPYYLAIFLQSECGKIQIERAKRGVGTVTIPQSLLKEISVPIPSIEFQKHIENEYKRMIELRRAFNYFEARRIFENIKKLVEQMVCR